jgi:hypothetical protein
LWAKSVAQHQEDEEQRHTDHRPRHRQAGGAGGDFAHKLGEQDQGQADDHPPPLVDGGLEGTAKGMLAHLSILFVPAGVGIVGKLDVLASHGVALAVVLTLSAA